MGTLKGHKIDVNKVFKTKEGTFVVNATFTEEEHAQILEIGLLTMLHHGPLPFVSSSSPDVYLVQAPSELRQ